MLGDGEGKMTTTMVHMHSGDSVHEIRTTCAIKFAFSYVKILPACSRYRVAQQVRLARHQNFVVQLTASDEAAPRPLWEVPGSTILTGASTFPAT